MTGTIIGVVVAIVFVLSLIGGAFEMFEKRKSLRELRKKIAELTDAIRKTTENEKLADLYLDRAITCNEIRKKFQDNLKRFEAEITMGLDDCNMILKLDPSRLSAEVHEELRSAKAVNTKDKRWNRINIWFWAAVAIVALFLNPSEKDFKKFFVASRVESQESDFFEAAQRVGMKLFLESMVKVEYRNYYLFSICDVDIRGMDLIEEDTGARYVGLFTVWIKIK